MSTLRNFYEILDSTPNATVDELKNNYKQLILQCHPDKLQQDKNQQAATTTAAVTTNNTNVAATVDPNATTATTSTNATTNLCDREFVTINEAWNTLKDPAKRKLYDAEQLLSKFQTHSNIYERLQLSDMKRTSSINAEEIIYTYDCRCGGQYIVDESADSALIFERSKHNNCVDKDNKAAVDNHDVVTDNNYDDDDDDGEVIVECSECSLVIILNG